MRRWVAWVALFAVHAAIGAPAVVQQPRSFGYSIGDVLTQRVLLEEGGHAFEPDALPAGGPIGVFLERRTARVETDDRSRRWLVLDYQVLNSPPEVKVVNLPAVKIARKGAHGQVLEVAPWPVSIAPFTPPTAFKEGNMGVLRPEHAAPLIDTVAMRRWLGIWVGAFVVSGAAWVGWWLWRNWLASSRLPFGVALRELRGVDEDEPRAWLALHRAFDGTAGQVVRADALGVLFQRAPEFERLRAAIERFYALSAERFFGRSPQSPGGSEKKGTGDGVGAESAAAGAERGGSGSAERRGAAGAERGGSGSAERRGAADAELGAPGELSLRRLCVEARRIEKGREL